MEEEDKQLIPAIVQDYQTGEVLMLAYVDDEALKRTKATGTTWFWSRSRKAYWNKGETSGNKQLLKEIRYDCDDDSYLFLVEQVGGIACHTGNRTCFYRGEDYSQTVNKHYTGASASIPADLYRVIESRRTEMPDASYTTELFAGGLESIVAKVEEESDEVIEAAREKDDSEVIWEAADLVYHLFVLLVYRGISFDELAAELARRRK